ncbi:MAG: LLM class flavin-dependent oxidoreductase [Phenylobacterium sp.]|uniref:LLM class flavin-dependent oxidoreductase n=1 Tax=Phenylobacterium sp. TaxID=1871053 RepID=UPI0025ECAC03|nr:LLM class flavin-dependent oxidoreductase [Phenylobacterium sp.]MBI1198679.1 LLM class flavin-dependent oxidoreductase [Phenylobacterium sp.]
MRFGLFGGVARTAEVAGDSQTYGTFIDYVVEAEALGFESLFLVEHHFTGDGQLSASLTLLSYLAGITSTMRLGTAVTVMPWHNPVLLTEQAALVDLVSNGRLEMGVGRGYRPNEFHGFCIDPSEAQARFEEAVDLLVKGWTSEERFSHEGAFWKFRDIVVEPQPVQRPHPPLWVAAGSEASIRDAAAKGRRVLLDQFGDMDLTRQRVAWYHDQLDREGRRPEDGCIAVTRGLLLLKDNDPAHREDEIRKRLDVIAAIKASAQIPGSAPEQPAGSFVNDSREATESAAIIGPPEECIARLKQLQSFGVDHVLLNDPWGGVDRLRLFAKTVMPAFRQDQILVDTAERARARA